MIEIISQETMIDMWDLSYVKKFFKHALAYLVSKL